MDETCDRCGPAVQARYRADRLGELFLCGPCAMRLWPALADQGWSLWLIGEPALATRVRSTPPGSASTPPRVR
ncbi:MAG: hypothetical protein ACRDOA_16540 [Streptosporangiaceae bacterium]